MNQRTPRESPIDRSPLAIFAAVFLIAEAILVFARGILSGDWGNFLVEAVLLIILCTLTARFTREDPNAPNPGKAIPAQLLCLLAIIVAVGLDGAVVNGIITQKQSVPLWSTARSNLITWVAHYLGANWGLALSNFAFYVGPALVIAAGLGASPASVGLGPIRAGAIRTALVWAVPLLVLTAMAHVSGPELLARFGRNLFMNGFSEELLFRGILFGRLVALVRTPWALMIQAILFAFLHLGADLRFAQGSWLFAIPVALAAQGSLGYALGFVRLRTGNVAVPTLIHAWYDALG